ncbi:TauD/TfdA family dioxygenase [Pigmentiphaga soli]|uniref:TauD/TfdA family dioxygenase n=1 Tax=Pigmentiphaga soli TaxID=1007095 RepID=A0ABP8GM96_9BURK
MIEIKPGGATLGATVTGVNLRQPLSGHDFAVLLRALGEYGVLCAPGQLLSAAELAAFASRFGKLQVLSASPATEPGMPEVTILSNVVENGKPIGTPDAGQFWHTDMTYNRESEVGFVNVLVAYAVPTRDGRPLGGTEFANTQAAYADLPDEIKLRLANATAIHDLNKSWEWLINVKKSPRKPLTPEQRRERPPVPHPVFLTHPITGRKVIYVNPNFVVNIEGMPPEESEATLDFLYRHILKPEYRYVHHWTVGDVLLWDHLGTWHNAIADYGPGEYRLMKRCQVMADRIFDPSFTRAALGIGGA